MSKIYLLHFVLPLYAKNDIFFLLILRLLLFFFLFLPTRDDAGQPTSRMTTMTERHPRASPHCYRDDNGGKDETWVVTTKFLGLPYEKG